MKNILATASLLALMTAPSFAQEATTPPTNAAPAEQNEMMPEKTAAYSGDISAAKLMGKSVLNSAGESVGDINDLRIDSSGKIDGVIVGVGGFLGLGEKNVALPFDQLAFARNADGDLKVTAKVTKESLQSAPEWKNPEDRSSGGNALITAARAPPGRIFIAKAHHEARNRCRWRKRLNSTGPRALSIFWEVQNDKRTARNPDRSPSGLTAQA